MSIDTITKEIKAEQKKKWFIFKIFYYLRERKILKLQLKENKDL